MVVAYGILVSLLHDAGEVLLKDHMDQSCCMISSKLYFHFTLIAFTSLLFTASAFISCSFDDGDHSEGTGDHEVMTRLDYAIISSGCEWKGVQNIKDVHCGGEEKWAKDIG